MRTDCATDAIATKPQSWHHVRGAQGATDRLVGAPDDHDWLDRPPGAWL